MPRAFQICGRCFRGAKIHKIRLGRTVEEAYKTIKFFNVLLLELTPIKLLFDMDVFFKPSPKTFHMTFYFFKDQLEKQAHKKDVPSALKSHKCDITIN